jgi:hypothetical protein
VELKKVRLIIDLAKARIMALVPEASVLLLAVTRLPMIAQITTPFVADSPPESHRRSGHLLPPVNHVRHYLPHGTHIVHPSMSHIDLTKMPLTEDDNSVVHVEEVSARVVVKTMQTPVL